MNFKVPSAQLATSENLNTTNTDDDSEAGVDPDLRTKEHRDGDIGTEHVLQAWNKSILGEASVAAVVANDKETAKKCDKGTLQSAIDIFKRAQVISMEDINEWRGRQNNDKNKYMSVQQMK